MEMPRFYPSLTVVTGIQTHTHTVTYIQSYILNNSTDCQVTVGVVFMYRVSLFDNRAVSDTHPHSALSTHSNYHFLNQVAFLILNYLKDFFPKKKSPILFIHIILCNKQCRRVGSIAALQLQGPLDLHPMLGEFCLSLFAPSVPWIDSSPPS